MTAKINMKIGYLFAVPIVEVYLEDCDRLNGELRDLFLAKEGEGDVYRDPQRRDTQHDVFESRFDLFKWPEQPVRELAAFCHTALTRVVRELSTYTDQVFDTMMFDYHAWFHVTRHGGYQGQHMHPNASWSGIYCIDPGDSVSGRPESGSVRFHDPRHGAMYYSDAGNANLRDTIRHGGFQFNHEPGKLTIFPSYLEHEVFAYQGERPRVVVAFNCWVNPK